MKNDIKIKRGFGEKLICLFVMTTLMLSSIVPAFGAQEVGGVKVSLPNFKVTLNGTVVNNDYSNYPLIVYKNITYFPMTYSDCRYLGIGITWNGTKAGLAVEKTNITAAYKPYITSLKNRGTYTATIPKFPIMINGKAVDNKKEEYPLLSFRDITYFPMTWKYGTEAFSWKYNFNEGSGLVITSANTPLSQKAISKDRPKEITNPIYRNKPSTMVALTDKYVYYEGTKGQIMQAPLADTSKAKMVYQLGLWSYAGAGDGTYNIHNLYSDNGKAMLYFHEGGAIMGSDTVLQLNDDGTKSMFNDNTTGKVVFQDKTFEWWIGPFPNPGMLTMKKGNGEAVSIGDPNILYRSPAYSDGDNLFILGRDEGDKAVTPQRMGLYKINLSTNETIKMSKTSVVDFVMEGDYTYHTDGAYIYKTQISTGKIETFGSFIMAPYGSIIALEVLGGHIYYLLEENRSSQGSKPYDPPQYSIVKLSQDNKKGEQLPSPDTLNLLGEMGMGIMGTTEKYLVCTFEEKNSTKYRIMVYDKNGRVVFKTSDKAYLRNITISGDTIYFYNITTETVCIGKLKPE